MAANDDIDGEIEGGIEVDTDPSPDGTRLEEPDGALASLLDFIKATRRFDFTGYKRTTIARRLAKRTHEVGVGSYAEYQDYLEVHPDEYEQFFNTILINVTQFFRDAAAWEFLAEEVVPRIVSAKRPGESIRVWSAGCATGEEAYSLAMVLAEALGADQFRDRVKIYATDVDDDALTKARQAVYTARDVENVPPDLRARYFEPFNGGSTFVKELRRSVIFGRHDLVQDAPISRVDLLVCRNTLMYFSADTQSGVLDRFQFSLNGHGYLFLGKAETLLTQSTAFEPLNLKQRIFRSVPDAPRPRELAAREAPDAPRFRTGGAIELRDLAFVESHVPQMLVDVNGIVVLVSNAARRLFHVSLAHVGVPLQDLELSYRPVELRSLIEDAYRRRQVVEQRGIEWAPPDNVPLVLDVLVSPLVDSRGELLGASISFLDVTRYWKLQEELEHAARELETAYEELQSTNEELETTNEELQSTIEELETTNEELQSTNEELETMNEELHSTNDELQIVNDALQFRSDELDQLHRYFESVLTGLGQGVIVVDRELNVLVWNHWSEDLWGLRADEVRRRHLVNLDIGLPIDQLLPAIRRCLDGAVRDERVTVRARNRRGRDLDCEVRVGALPEEDGQAGGVILLVQELGGGSDGHAGPGARRDQGSNR